MTSNLITATFLAYRDMLELLDALPAHEADGLTAAEIASRTGRVASNLRRDTVKFEREGYLAQGGDVSRFVLGATGRAALAAWRKIDAQPVTSDTPVWPLDKFRRNPDQPRKTFPDEMIVDRAESIVAAGGILHALVVDPADENGVRMIQDGECRWRAVQLLVQQGRLPETLQRGLPYVERQGGEAQMLKVALIANAQRSDLTPWEDAQALKRLKDLEKLSARGVAMLLGRAKEGSERGVGDVQQKIRTAEKATPANIKLHEAGVWTWEQLRESVREKAEPSETPATIEAGLEQVELETAIVANVAAQAAPDQVELSDFAFTTLLEISAACQRRPYDLKAALGPTTKITQSITLTNRHRATEAELVRNGLVFFNSGWPASVTLLRPGEQHANRQAWTGTIEQRLLSARKRVSDLSEAELVIFDQDGKYLTDFLNVPPDPVPTSLTDEQALALLELWDAWKRGGGGGYDPSKPAYHGAQINPELDLAVLTELAALKVIESGFDKPGSDGCQRAKPRSWSRPSAAEALQGRWPDYDTNGPRNKALEEIRTTVLGAEEAARLKKEKVYASAWLNPPFPVTQAAQRARAEAEAEAQRRADAVAKREQAAKEAEDRMVALEARAPEMDLAELGAEIAAYLGRVGAPAPWSPPGSSWQLAKAGNGGIVGTSNDHAVRLAIMALNAITKTWPVVTADAGQADDDEDGGASLDRETFLQVISDRLNQVYGWPAEATPSAAEAALARDLKELNCEFGAEDSSWDADDAGTIADNWAEDFDAPVPIVVVLNTGSMTVPFEHWADETTWVAANIRDGEYIGPVEVPAPSTTALIEEPSDAAA